jgi:hypothetical protein
MEAPERFAHYPSFMLPTDNGAWVRWSDYATLATRLAEVEAQRNFAQRQVVAAEDRAERLEAALRDIVDSGGSYGSLAYMQRVDGIARAALQQEGGE